MFSCSELGNNVHQSLSWHFYLSEYIVVHSGRLSKIKPLAQLDKVCILSCVVLTCLDFWVPLSCSKTKSYLQLLFLGLAVSLDKLCWSHILYSNKLHLFSLPYSYWYMHDLGYWRCKISGVPLSIGVESVDLNPKRFDKGIYNFFPFWFTMV